MPVALGQVFTPTPVADLVLALALRVDGTRRVLDPSCGDGVFLARAAARGIAAEGVEIDPAAAAAARARTGATVTVADFLDLPPPDEPFDVVVGNPPYIRQELVGGAKARIAARIAADWPEGPRVRWSGRADLALSFVARSLRFVKPGGRVALVVSAAILETGYGAILDGFLAGRGHIAGVVASPRERWFRRAAVNAIILVIDRAHEAGLIAAPRPTVCARLRVPVDEAAARVRSLDDLSAVADVCLAAPSTALAPRLRASDVWLAAVSAGAHAHVPLGAIAEVRRGVTSGANAFFYLDRSAAARAGLSSTVVQPVLRSPRAAPCIAVRSAALATLAFMADAPLHDLPAAARAYIAAHAAAVAGRPTLAGRERWWALPASPAQLFLTKAYHSRFVQPLADTPVLCDQRFYAVRPRPGVPLELLAAVLNGTLTALALEALGRASLGEGALEISVADAARLPVLDPRLLQAGPVLAAFWRLARRVTGDARSEASAPDRSALDRALTEHLPALAALVPELGSGLASAVDDRLLRARATLAPDSP